MRAAVAHEYGGPEVYAVCEVDAPVVGDGDLLVQVLASPVTAGDRRIRAADYPSFTAVIGRMLFGLLRPRHPVQGTMFAGRVLEVGAGVTAFAVGDDVFGAVDRGAYGEQVVVAADGAVALMPEGFDHAQMAAVPYGAETAWHFLHGLADVKPGESVAIVGAAGGVGRFAVQVAKHLGAVVTAVASSRSEALVRELGADHVVDYRREDFATRESAFDVVFDVAGVSSFRHSRASLKPGGRFLTPYVSLTVLAQMAWTSWVGSRRALFGVALGNQATTAKLRALVEEGAIWPVVVERFPLTQIDEAHRMADQAGVDGCVVVQAASS